MGWSGGNTVFDPMCWDILHSSMGVKEQGRMLVKLIKSLQELDWDTEDESLSRFHPNPLVTEVFKVCGISFINFDDEE